MSFHTFLYTFLHVHTRDVSIFLKLHLNNKTQTLLFLKIKDELFCKEFDNVIQFS